MLNKIKAIISDKIKDKPDQKKPDISLSIATLMIEIMYSDDYLDDKEYSEITASLKSRFDLSTSQVKELIEKAEKENAQATDFHQFTSQIKDNYSTTERIDFLTELWQVAMVDGHIDHNEEHLIRRIANLIGIYHDEFIGSKLGARESIQKR